MSRCMCDPPRVPPCAYAVPGCESRGARVRVRPRGGCEHVGLCLGALASSLSPGAIQPAWTEPCPVPWTAALTTGLCPAWGLPPSPSSFPECARTCSSLVASPDGALVTKLLPSKDEELLFIFLVKNRKGRGEEKPFRSDCGDFCLQRNPSLPCSS